MMIVVSAVIDRLSRRYPRLTFDVTGGDTNLLLAQLRHRDVDLLVSRIGDSIEDDLETETLFDDQLVVVAGKGNAWIGRRKVVLDDLMRERWILPAPDTFLRPYIEDAFRARGLELPTATIIGKSAHLRNNLLARANFLTIFPHAMMRLGGWHPAIRSLNVDLPTTRRPVALVTLRKRSHNPATRLFIEEARRVAKPLR
jgi:DNA-binding transcriptional LysR family regulator